MQNSFQQVGDSTVSSSDPRREAVQDLRVLLDEQAAASQAGTGSGSELDASMSQAAKSPTGAAKTSVVGRANEMFDRSVASLPAWSLPVGGCLLMFVGAALLTRGVISRKHTRAAMDPRERALRALGLRAGKSEHAGEVLGAKVLERMRT